MKADENLDARIDRNVNCTVRWTFVDYDSGNEDVQRTNGQGLTGRYVMAQGFMHDSFSRSYLSTSANLFPSDATFL